MTIPAHGPERDCAHSDPSELGTSPRFVRLLEIIPFTLWFGWLVFDIHMGRSRPFAPDPRAGLVIPHTEHGITTYLSENDSLTLNGMFWGAIASTALLILLREMARTQTFSPNFSWLQKFDGRNFKQSNGQGVLAVASVVLLVAYTMFG